MSRYNKKKLFMYTQFSVSYTDQVDPKFITLHFTRWMYKLPYLWKYGNGSVHSDFR